MFVKEGGPPDSTVSSHDSLFLLWEAVRSIRILGSFNLAFTLLAGLRFCLLSLRTRFLILLANGVTEALL